MLLWYGLHPLGLLQEYDGCGEPFTMDHALYCEKSGLIGIWYDDQQDEFVYSTVCIISNSRVTYKPKIFY